MDQITESSGEKRNIWLRVLLMLLMGLAFQVSGTVLGIVTVIQFVIVLISDAPNERLVSFGRSLGAYMQEIVHFLTFVTEEVPFPFSEWPSNKS